jgi:hypothetical protein
VRTKKQSNCFSDNGIKISATGVERKIWHEFETGRGKRQFPIDTSRKKRTLWQDRGKRQFPIDTSGKKRTLRRTF